MAFIAIFSTFGTEKHVQKFKRTIPDLTGKKVSMLTVIRECAAPNGERGTWYLCVCECGNERPVIASLLHRGKVTSCGCKRRGGKRTSQTKSLDYSCTLKPLSLDKLVAKKAYGVCDEFFSLF